MRPKDPIVKPGGAARAAPAASVRLPEAVAAAATNKAGGAVAQAGDNIGTIPVSKSLQPPAVAAAPLNKRRPKSTPG